MFASMYSVGDRYDVSVNSGRNGHSRINSEVVSMKFLIQISNLILMISPMVFSYLSGDRWYWLLYIVIVVVIADGKKQIDINRTGAQASDVR